MKAIVTGASGYLGYHIIKALKDEGYCGLASCRGSSKIQLPEGWAWAARASILSDSEFKLGAIDTVIHLEVKQHSYDSDGSTREQMWRTNVENTAEWLDWSAARNVRKFVYFSSIKAGLRGGNGCPDSYYGMTKREAEKLVASWSLAKSERIGIIFRPAVVYGVGCKGNIGLLARLVRKRRFLLPGRCENRKATVSLTNLCAALVYLLKTETMRLETIDLCDPECLTVREIVATLAAAAKVEMPREIPVSAARLIATICDQLERYLGVGSLPTSARLRAICEEQLASPDRLLELGFKHPERPRQAIAAVFGAHDT